MLFYISLNTIDLYYTDSKLANHLLAITYLQPPKSITEAFSQSFADMHRAVKNFRSTKHTFLAEVEQGGSFLC